ncbi:MAG: hypothetical protein ABMA26_06190 [Limisphaerales bacterium]
MKIDITKLKHPRTSPRDGGNVTIARCPACEEEGADNKGDHLIVFPDGRFGCVVNPAEDEDSHDHRKRILELVGIPCTSRSFGDHLRYVPKTTMPSATATVRVVKLKKPERGVHL